MSIRQVTSGTDVWEVAPLGAGSARSRSRAVVCGSATTVGVYALLSAGIIPSLISLLIPVLLVVVVPTAESLSRRVAVNGALLLGWTPVIWWVRWPVPVNHGVLVVALTAGTLVAWVLGSVSPRRRSEQILPAVTYVDSLPWLCAFAGWITMHTWALAASPSRALTLLMTAYDNVAHFDMFSMLRRYGATVDTLGSSPDGSAWSYANYPQGFHAVVATYAELVHPRVGTGVEEVVFYTHAVAAVVVFATAILVASVCSLPGLRHRPAVALPAIVFLCTAFLWGPGAQILADGFANFWLASVAVSCTIILSIPARGSGSFSLLAAIGGLVVLTAHSWLPLLLLSAPGALVLLFRSRRSLPPRSGQRIAQLALCSAVLGGIAKAAFLVRDVPVGKVVAASGAIHGTSPTPLFALIVVSAYVCASYSGWLRRLDAVHEVGVARQVGLLALVPLLGLASLFLLLAAQLRALGKSSYYLLKYASAVELTMATLALGVAAMLFSVVTKVPARRIRALASLGALLAATQCFGHVTLADALMLSTSNDSTTGPPRPPVWLTGVAAEVAMASAQDSQAEGFRRDYLLIGYDKGYGPYPPDVWYHVLTGSLTLKDSQRYGLLQNYAVDVGAAVPMVRGLLAAREGSEVVVAPRWVASLREQLGSADLAGRVRSWPEGRSVEAEGER